MRWRPALLLAAFVALLALTGCRGASESSSTATATPTEAPAETATPEVPPIDILPTETATPPPTATPLPPAAPGAVWAFDLGRGKRTVIYEGDREPASRIEASGNGVTTALEADGTPAAMRHLPNGDVVEEHDNRGVIVSTASGESRFYLDLSDPADPDLILEHRGEVIPLEGTRARDGVAFSPSGDRLLTVSVRPRATEGEEIRTFSVHTTDDGRLRMQFEHQAVTDAPPLAVWSPSGRYVADQGLEGLFIRDTVSGHAWYLGPGGSTRWSPLGDQLLAITDRGHLTVISMPGLDGVDLGPIDRDATVLFDRSGRYAIATSYADAEPVTRAYEVASGAEVAAWPGMDTSVGAIGGFNPVITVDDGIAAVFTSADCDGGFVVVHPTIGTGGRCIEGANARWSPRAELLVYARDREIVVLNVASDTERVIAGGTPPADVAGGPLLRWSPDGSWILIQWPWNPTDYLSIVR